MIHERVICNTGPLIALAIIDRLVILKDLFREVVVPEAVHEEILRGGPVLAGISHYRKADWIAVRALDKTLDPLLRSVLDVGEASVIQLAMETETALVLIDELKARKLARTVFHLQVVGSVRLLVEAKRIGSIPNVGDAIQGLREGGYWIHDDIVRSALKEAGEL